MMSALRVLTCVLTVVVVSDAACVSLGAEQKLVLQDHIKKQWSRELVTYPFQADRGQCHRDSVTVTGPEGEVACQLSDIKFWPGSRTFVKAAMLSFVVDLAPLAEDSYTVRYGTTAVKGPKSDLVVKKTADSVELGTTLFGARLLLGEKTYRKPVAAKQAPGPIVAMRIEGGKWLPGSRMVGTTRIKSYSAKLVAEGPVFAEVATRYTYEDGNTLEVTLHVAAGDGSILIDMDVKREDKESGWRMRLADPSRELVFRHCTERDEGTWVDVPLGSRPPGKVTGLTPWSDWWDDATQTEIRLTMPGRKRELRITRRDAGAWVKPGPLGKYGATGRREEKTIPLMRGKSGELYLQIGNHQGQRKWAFGIHPIRQEDPRKDLPNTWRHYYLARHKVFRPGIVGRHLNQVKDWTLDWEVKTEHPHLYMSKEQLRQVQRRKLDTKHLAKMLEIAEPQRKMRSSWRASNALGAYLLTGRKDLAEKYLLVEMLDELLGRLGVVDTWRYNAKIASLYDAMMGSDLLSGEQRKLFRARFAYLGYRSAAPSTWSMERGYCSGNLNMSVNNYMNLGVLACTIPDHPMAPAWVKPAMVMTENLLAEKVGPAGEWPESVAHYAHVASSTLLVFAVAAKNAGLADFVNDERMKRLMLFLAKQYSPPDPRHTERGKEGKASLLPPVGRGAAGEAYSQPGMMAAATVRSDPAYSRVMQWVWFRTGMPSSLAEEHTLGWEEVCMDPSLPARKPDWGGLDYFPRTGAIMRHGLGTPNEWYIYTICENRYTVPAESGTTPLIFARGTPISSRFACSYPDREELLLSRVLLARELGSVDYRLHHYGHQAKRKITGLSDLPRQKYLRGDFTIEQVKPVLDMGTPKPNSYTAFRMLPQWPKVAREGKPNVAWRRQLLFVHDDDPAGAGYLVFRDTVSGGQPTMWQFWTVSEKIGTAKEATDRERFLADKPGNRTLDARRLKPSDRYTALGQFDLDVEFYIAEPTAGENTPRHTLRFGLTHNYVTLGGYSEYQDLLHLQRPDDGTYFVIVYPRKRRERAPTFETLAAGKVIKVAGTFGTDYCFLSDKPAKATAAEAVFEGTAGSVQDRESGLVLSLAAGGLIVYKQHRIACDGAVALRVKGGGLSVAFPAGHPGATATIQVPGSWGLSTPAEGVTLTQTAGGALQIRAAQGVAAVRLTKR